MSPKPNSIKKTRLSSQDHRLLSQYARETASGYCAGCARLCESALSKNMPVSDVMRYLMYYHNYGRRRQAIRKFNNIPAIYRRRLASMDYSEAERICPQKIPIASFMQHAVETFSNQGQG